MSKRSDLESLLGAVEGGRLDGGAPHCGLDVCKLVRAYHGSLDAANAVHDAVLPEYGRSVDATVPEMGIEVSLHKDGAEQFSGDHQPTEARAWLIAVIKVLIAMEPEDEQTPHLWEVQHPYYMHEGNHYRSGHHSNYDSFDAFLSEWGDTDLDYNRVHRWDWKEGDDCGVESDGSDDVIGRLSVYFIMQRKASTYSCDIDVRRSDEQRVIEYLKPHMAREKAIWHPLSAMTDQKEAQ